MPKHAQTPSTARPLPPDGPALRVVVIDDDPHILDAFSTLLDMEGYAVQSFPSAQAYLQALGRGDAAVAETECILCDVMMPEIDGLQLQAHLADLGDPSVVLMSGSSGAQEAIHGFRAGAVDFLLKPIESQELLDAVARAVRQTVQQRKASQRRQALRHQWACLSGREREVMHSVASGMTNLGIALTLGISERTVKYHRQRIIEKLGLTGTADVVRLAQEFEQSSMAHP